MTRRCLNKVCWSVAVLLACEVAQLGALRGAGLCSNTAASSASRLGISMSCRRL